MTVDVVNSIYSTADGGTWVLEAANPAFSARYGHTSVVFNGDMWVIGGIDDPGTVLNDVWSSSDGSTWSCAQSNAAFGTRQYHASVVFDNMIWVIGGKSGTASSTALSSIYYSADGIQWAEAELPYTFDSFPARFGHTAVVHDPGDGNGERIYIIGGRDSSNTDLNDVWVIM